MMYKGVL